MSNDSKLNRRNFIKDTTGAAAAFLAMRGISFGKNNVNTPLPNILWLSIEDTGMHFSCYGDPYVKTANIDALASEGVRYTNACCVAGVCAPSRTGIITGMYPSALGANEMRCDRDVPGFVEAFPEYLKQAGYYCTNHKKTDYQGTVSKWDSGNHWRDRPDTSTPFFTVLNNTSTHESQYKNPASSAPDSIPNFPPYYPDTDKSRRVWQKYCQKVEGIDKWVKEHIDDLKNDGLYEDTIIVFWSDHGAGLPRAKRWVYDSGTRVPLIVRIPEKFRDASPAAPGSESDTLINMIDLGPTMLNLTGREIPEHMHGQPFLGQDLPPAREYLFAARDRIDERVDMVRACRDKRYIYIRNFMPWEPYSSYVNYLEEGEMMKELRKAKASETLPPEAELFMSDCRDREELYDLQNDPHETVNLAGSPQHQPVLEQMRQALVDWMIEIRDVGPIPECHYKNLENNHETVFEAMQQGSDNLTKTYLEMMHLLNQGGQAKSDFLTKLSDSDPVIRYWAAMGLGNLGKAVADARPQLEATESDSHNFVKIAAGRALCYIGIPDSGLPLLEEGLEGSDEEKELALNFLDALGNQALPLKDKIQNASGNGNVKQLSKRCIETINESPVQPWCNPTVSNEMLPSKNGLSSQLEIRKNGIFLGLPNPGKYHLVLSDIAGGLHKEYFENVKRNKPVRIDRPAPGRYILTISGENQPVQKSKLIIP